MNVFFCNLCHVHILNFFSVYSMERLVIHSHIEGHCIICLHCLKLTPKGVCYDHHMYLENTGYCFVPHLELRIAECL